MSTTSSGKQFLHQYTNKLVLQGMEQYWPRMVAGGPREQVIDSGIDPGNDLVCLGGQEPGNEAMGTNWNPEDLEALVPIDMLPLNARGSSHL